MWKVSRRGVAAALAKGNSVGARPEMSGPWWVMRRYTAVPANSIVSARDK